MEDLPPSAATGFLWTSTRKTHMADPAQQPNPFSEGRLGRGVNKLVFMNHSPDRFRNMNHTSQDLASLWNQISSYLQGQIRKEAFDRWIGVIRPISLGTDTLHLGVANGFYQEWLENYYLELIQEAVAEIGEQPLKIRFQVLNEELQGTDSDTSEDAPEESGNPRRRPSPSLQLPTPAPLVPRPNLNPKNKFENFVVGPNNQFCHAGSMAVANSPAKAYNPFFIYGGVGFGKTHLMQAIGHRVWEENNSKRVVYISSEQFTNEFIDAIQNRTMPNFRRRYRNADVLLIDDIHFLAGKERLQEEFFHTFNTLFDAHKQIVMTSDRPANEISNLEQRLVSRFEWGLVTEISLPDLETRVAILLQKAKEMDFELSVDAAVFIAERINSNVRTLEGALLRLSSFSSLEKTSINEETAAVVLKGLLREEETNVVSIPEIQRAVCEHFDIRISDIMGQKRPRSIAYPRQIAMFLSRELTEASYPEIGRAFGGKDHGTVLHAHKKIKEKAETDTSLKKTIREIQDKL
ncbi:MAG: chromosomal replication initiator protein DnaA [Verrucomicrobiota bacterium]|nr:chromosomal replication initiator protein DnaA [Verrucomicrobiota bacterium]